MATKNRQSRTGQVLMLLQSKEGASLPKLQKLTGWQLHTIRGFMSGTIKKKLGYAVISEKLSNGDRNYRIAKDQ
ncbi:hypothetical protein F183_A55310 (plasmid) [Bryobacterales bacterium F-183]|nr:hypothetical protein F183_A55310 [Bryobacterales bacterium F-183]